jgi:hypothetical protein
MFPLSSCIHSICTIKYNSLSVIGISSCVNFVRLMAATAVSAKAKSLSSGNRRNGNPFVTQHWKSFRLRCHRPGAVVEWDQTQKKNQHRYPAQHKRPLTNSEVFLYRVSLSELPEKEMSDFDFETDSQLKDSVPTKRVPYQRRRGVLVSVFVLVFIAGFFVLMGCVSILLWGNKVGLLCALGLFGFAAYLFKQIKAMRS